MEAYLVDDWRNEKQNCNTITWYKYRLWWWANSFIFYSNNLSGTESSFGDQIEDRANYRFTIRYYSALTPKHRISYNSKLFNIQHVASQLEGKERYQIIDAEEGVAT